MLVAGTTGSGKSALTQTVVLQSSGQFGFIVVVDHGFSWERTVYELDPTCRAIVVRSNGGQTFNPFDTIGLPLSGQQLTGAVGLCHLLVGRSRDEDKDKLRSSVLAETIWWAGPGCSNIDPRQCPSGGVPFQAFLRHTDPEQRSRRRYPNDRRREFWPSTGAGLSSAWHSQGLYHREQCAGQNRECRCGRGTTCKRRDSFHWREP
jgi:hypothetical protein